MHNSTTTEDVLSYESYLATGIYVGIIGILASVGNLTVILVICGNRKRINLAKKQHIPLLLNLAVADIGVSIFGYPYTSLSGIAGRWLFEDAVCTMSAFCCFLLSMVSLDTLLAISIYRYIVICKPALKTRLTPRNTFIVVLATWGYAVLWASIPLFGPAAYTYEPFGTSCSIGWKSGQSGDVIFIVLVDIMCFIVHLFIMMFCYIQIIRRYRYISDPTISGPNSGQGLSALRSKRDMRITWLVLIQVGSFVGVWIPYAVVCAWYMTHELPLWVTTLPTMLAKLSCALNPILYGLLNKRFRLMSRDILCKCLGNKVEQSASKYQPAAWNLPRPTAIDIFCVSPNIETPVMGMVYVSRPSPEPKLVSTREEHGRSSNDRRVQFRHTASVDRFSLHKHELSSLFEESVGKSNTNQERLHRNFETCQSFEKVGFSSTHSSPTRYSVQDHILEHRFHSESILYHPGINDFRRNVLSRSNNMCRTVWTDMCASTTF